MRKFLGLSVFALTLSLAACDSSSSSTTGTGTNDSTGATGSLLGTWKSTSSYSSTSFSLVDVEVLTLSANKSFKVRHSLISTSTVAGIPGSESADSMSGTWSASSTMLYLTENSGGRDSGSYTLSGSDLTLVIPSIGMSDTLKFVRQ